MKIGVFEPYKGYTGSIEYDPEDNLLYGLLDCDDLINYRGKDVMELHRQYMAAVDDYKEMQKELAKGSVLRSLERLKIANPKQTIIVDTPKGSCELHIGDAKIYEGLDGEIVIDSE